MKKKLSLNIKLSIDENSFDNYTYETYCVSVKFIQIHPNFTMCHYMGFEKNNFRLEYSIDNPNGGLTDNSLNIPNLNNIKNTYTKIFLTENGRYKFVKKLYNILKNYAKSSLYEISIDNDIWTVYEKENSLPCTTNIENQQSIKNFTT